MTRFEEKCVEADGFRVRYWEGGPPEAAPLVHFHSAGGPKISPAHELLAETWRVIELEIPGFGSDRNDRSGSLAELGGSLMQALSAMGLERFNLWGTSFGGAVALAAALGAPESLDALVLEGPGAISPEGGYPNDIHGPEDLHCYLWAHPDRHPLAEPVDPPILENRRALVGRLQPLPRAELEQRMTTLDVPTLVVFGTHDRLTPPELGRIYVEKLPRCHFVMLYDTAHEAAAERPEAFCNLVTDFLQRKEAFVVSQKSSLVHP